MTSSSPRARHEGRHFYFVLERASEPFVLAPA